MGVHKRLSASDAGRWIHCTKSIPAEEALVAAKKIKKNTSSKDADEGTAAHFVLTNILQNVLFNEWDFDSSVYLDMVVHVSSEGNTFFVEADKIDNYLKDSLFTVDQEMLEYIDVAVKFTKDTLVSLGGTPDVPIPADVSVDLEKRLDFSHLGRTDIGGTCDIRISKMMGPLYVTDFKYGRGVAVYAEENEQLLVYACGDEVIELQMNSTVYLVIIQPRCPFNKDIEIWETDPASVLDWQDNVMKKASDAIEEENTTYNPGEKQCRWCKVGRSGNCGAKNSLALSAAVSDFEDLDDVKDSEIIDRVKEASPDQLLKVLNNMDLILNVVEAAQKRAVELIKSGHDVPGFKVVESITKRKYVDNAEEILLKKRIPKSVLYKQTLQSFGILSAVNGGIYKKIVESVLIKPDGAHTLAHAADKRPALIFDPTADFDDLDEDDLLS